MKITELKKIVKQSVKEAIQEELKDILLEAVRSPKQIVENKPVEVNNPVNTKTRQEIKESYKNIKIAQWFIDPMVKHGPDYEKNKESFR